MAHSRLGERPCLEIPSNRRKEPPCRFTSCWPNQVSTRFPFNRFWCSRRGESFPPPERNPVWVLNENLLLQKFQNLPLILEPKQVIEVCALIERYAAS